jgi:hypothetical protein
MSPTGLLLNGDVITYVTPTSVATTGSITVPAPTSPAQS